MTDVLAYLLLLVFPAAMAFAGATDLLTMTIPNRISLVVAGVFPIAALAAGLDGAAWMNHAGAGALVLAAGIAMFAAGWLGGGDAKLLAAASLWIGLGDLVTYLAQVGILGGGLALLILAYRRLPLPVAAGPEWASRLHEQGTGIPYGLAIAGGALWIYPTTVWFRAFAM